MVVESGSACSSMADNFPPYWPFLRSSNYAVVRLIYTLTSTHSSNEDPTHHFAQYCKEYYVKCTLCMRWLWKWKLVPWVPFLVSAWQRLFLECNSAFVRSHPASQPLCMDNYTCMHRKLHKNTLRFWCIFIFGGQTQRLTWLCWLSLAAFSCSILLLCS